MWIPCFPWMFGHHCTEFDIKRMLSIHPILYYVKPCLQHAYKGLPVCDITASLETSDTCKSVTEVT